VTGEQVVGSVYPALIRQSSWVLLNFAIVRDDRDIINIGNTTISYAYPTELLQASKNLLYNNGSVEIYK
jgi:hypothetical protein